MNPCLAYWHSERLEKRYSKQDSKKRYHPQKASTCDNSDHNILFFLEIKIKTIINMNINENNKHSPLKIKKYYKM